VRATLVSLAPVRRARRVTTDGSPTGSRPDHGRITAGSAWQQRELGAVSASTGVLVAVTER